MRLYKKRSIKKETVMLIIFIISLDLIFVHHPSRQLCYGIFSFPMDVRPDPDNIWSPEGIDALTRVWRMSGWGVGPSAPLRRESNTVYSNPYLSNQSAVKIADKKSEYVCVVRLPPSNTSSWRAVDGLNTPDRSRMM